MIATILQIAIIPLTLYLVTYLPWPTIPQDVFYTIANFLKFLGQFNTWLPLDTLFNYVVAIVTIELCLFYLRIAGSIQSMVTGRHSILSTISNPKIIDTNEQDEERKRNHLNS